VAEPPRRGRSETWTRRELLEAFGADGSAGRLDFDQSVLRQVRPSPAHLPLFELARLYERISIHRDWNLSRDSAPRKPQPADLPQDFLLADAGNLGLVINDLDYRFGMAQMLVDDLRRLHPAARRIGTRVAGGTVQLFLDEGGLTQPIPATRMSDGTLRFLCMLVILRHPEPPPLVCIEEPEIGLHPDAMPALAELMLDAAARTQLAVTTHSDILVSALSKTPEAIVVCERDEAGTHLRRLEAGPLKEWVERYALGEAWLEGQIGGTVR
jgi:predicted ATPase